MNIRTIGIAFIVTVLLLLTFQAVWLYNTYHLEKERMQVSINDFLAESIKEEMLLRFSREMKQKGDTVNVSTSKEYPVLKDSELEIAEFDLLESVDNGLLQFYLLLSGFPIQLSVLDSLFQQKLIESKYELDYLIYYKDSTDLLSESIGKLALNTKTGIFVSDSIPIVSKNYVHVLSELSPSTVLKQMIGLTIASFVMLLVLLFALIYQIRYTYRQYKLNRLREDFSQALTHDLKSPLNTIYIALSNFKNGVFEKNPDFASKATVVAMEQVLNIQALVDKILTIARLEERGMELVRTEIDLPELIRKLTERYSYSSTKEILFKTTCNPDDIAVYADYALLENAVGNLIDNAIKYSGKTVTIQISCEIKQEKLYIRVEDDGYGISEDEQSKIFNKFERGSAVYRKEAKGFGLGLNYVRKVAIAHQGTVGVSSVNGKGSEFVIAIPLLLKAIDNDKIEQGWK